MHYQPKVDLKTLRVGGAEALIRWLHPREGLIPPGEFIPLAEAEGVEDLASLHLLISWGCDLAQGFYFSRPIPPMDFMGWMAAWVKDHAVPGTNAFHRGGLAPRA